MKTVLTTLAVVLSLTLVLAQTFSKQGISFSLIDKSGTRLTDAAINDGTIKIYSMRDAKVVKDQDLKYNPENGLFTFTEEAISPGVALALVSATDTMYISLFGRSGTNRVIDPIIVQRGSYVLTSNEFAGNKTFKVTDWRLYLEDEVPAAQQDLSAYAHQLKSKKQIKEQKTQNSRTRETIRTF